MQRGVARMDGLRMELGLYLCGLTLHPNFL